MEGYAEMMRELAPRVGRASDEMLRSLSGGAIEELTTGTPAPVVAANIRATLLRYLLPEAADQFTNTCVVMVALTELENRERCAGKGGGQR